MSLDTLPAELMIIILRQLDLKSIQNLYETGNQRIQNVISFQGAIKTIRLSLSSLATAETLKLNFFKALSNRLIELDLSAVKDLTKTALLPAMKKLKSLVTLNVGYTNINISDLLEIYQICPTIKNVTVNFVVNKPKTNIRHFPKEALIQCQDMFGNFENVHFIGSTHNLFYSNFPVYLLQKAELNTLTYTVSHEPRMFTYHKYVENKPLKCNKLTLNMLHWKNHFYNHSLKEDPNIIKELGFEYEFIHIHDCSITISSAFENYFRENYRYNRICVEPKLSDKLYYEDHIFMLWNKETNNFDDNFFQKFDSEIKSLHPCVVTYSDGMAPVVLSNNWVCVIHPLIHELCKPKPTNQESSKRKRVAVSNVTLDYDELLEDKDKVQLTVSLYNRIYCSINLSSSSNFLQKLTFLQLRGDVKCTREFFNILFRCCYNLVTLDVESNYISLCASIARSIPLSRTLKNFRIVDKQIDLNTLFSSLSQCSTLENVVITVFAGGLVKQTKQS